MTTASAATKKGFTLIEMLVTAGLFAIIVTIAVGGFANAIRTQRQVSSLISAQSNVSLALEQMARQIRTGYLFCNVPENEATSSGNGIAPAAANAGCACALSTSTPGWWTCSNLAFYDANSNPVEYFLNNGALVESSTLVQGGGQSVTGDTVSVQRLEFLLYGQTEGDTWPPRVTILLTVAPSSTDPAIAGDTFNLETTVSARSIDCTEPNASGTVSC